MVVVEDIVPKKKQNQDNDVSPMMTDSYEYFTRKLFSLREEMYKEIRNILKRKGFSTGCVVNVPFTDEEFKIEFDRIIFNGYNLEQLKTEDVLKAMRAAMHVICVVKDEERAIEDILEY